VGGAPGIAVETVRCNRLAAAAFAGVIKTTDDATPRDEHGH
jgi:hypothetical protein